MAKANVVGSTQRLDEVYDLRGVNLSDPDMVRLESESPKADNCRMYARQDGETRVAIRTRKGSQRLSTPVGEALNVQNVGTSTGDVAFTASTWLILPFTPSSTGALTKFEFEIKRTVAGGGHVIVQVYTNNGGIPGTLLAQGAILGGTVGSTYSYLPAYFMDAPTVANGTQYWVLAKVQTGGSATYALNKTAAAGGKSTANSGVSYTTLGYSWRYKTYLSTAAHILGFTRRYPSNKQNRTLFAMGTNLYAVTDAGVPTSISSAIGSTSEKVRFAQIDDRTMIVDGVTPAKWYDGTTVTVMNNVAGNPTNVIIFKNRAFFVPDNDPTRVNFSELFSFEVYPSTNFFYVPSPKSVDHITAWKEFQSKLVIFTHETKHVVSGSSIGTFTRDEAIGTKGAVSQEATAADRNYIYFMADDKMIYRYNGVEDELLSEKVEPELQSITDVSKVSLHLYRNQLRIYYARGTDTEANDMLLLELSQKESNKYLQWFHDNGRAVSGSLEWTHSNNELIEFSSKVGATYLGETSESDLGKPINFKYWTKYKAYGSGMAKDRVRRFRPFVRPTDSPYYLSVGKDIDFKNDPQMTSFLVDAGGAKWGHFTWGDGTKWGSKNQLVDSKVPMSGRGKHTQYRFECNLVDAPVNLYGYAAIVKSGRPR
jgi:hypothetical protein